MKLNPVVFLFFALVSGISQAESEPYVDPLKFEVSSDPSSFVEPPPGMDPDSGSDSFKLFNLLGTSLEGMFDEKCGGYCITGACAHLNWGISLFHGLYFYTIISPKLEHAMPELLITSYDSVGNEPFYEWRETFGKIVSTANTTTGSMLGIFDGLQMGRPDPNQQGVHQTVSSKEVDIIGHPLTLLPDIVNDGGKTKIPDYQLPQYKKLTQLTNPKTEDKATGKKADGFFDVDLDKMKIPSMGDVVNYIKEKAKAAIAALNIVKKIREYAALYQTIKNIKKIMNTVLDTFRASAAAATSGMSEIVSPRYRAPRLFCPTKVQPIQPYYLSFMDAFWWRSGYPITDGPLSGTDHTMDIINPLSMDTLQKVSSKSELLTKEIWGHLYPRDGSINQSHDAKTASVLAWRALDVLQTSVKDGYRVGVELPTGGGNGKWQLIYPQVKSCRDDPYYPQEEDKTIDSLLPSSKGGYAWNYYRTYSCCSNEKGDKIASVDFVKICIPMASINAGIESDRAAYDKWKKDQMAK